MSATGERGATLIEMLLVVGLMALIIGLVFPAAQGGVERGRLEHARADLVASLRQARAAAMCQGHEVRFDLAADGGRYGWGQTATTLPAGLAATADREALKFYADGSASGGAVKLAGHGRSLSIMVDPVTGVVRPAGGG